MPVYRYGCKKCDHEEDGFRTIDERHDSPLCCGDRMYIVICPSYVQDDIPAYLSPTTGRVIGSRTARRDDLKRSRSRPYEGYEQESKEAARQRSYADAKFDKTLTDTAHKVWHEMPPSKRAILDGSE